MYLSSTGKTCFSSSPNTQSLSSPSFSHAHSRSLLVSFPISLSLYPSHFFLSLSISPSLSVCLSLSLPPYLYLSLSPPLCPRSLSVAVCGKQQAWRARLPPACLASVMRRDAGGGRGSSLTSRRWTTSASNSRKHDRFPGSPRPVRPARGPGAASRTKRIKPSGSSEKRRTCSVLPRRRLEGVGRRGGSTNNTGI